MCPMVTIGWFEARQITPLAPFPKLISINLNIAKNLAQQSRAEVASLVHRNRGAASVGMLELPVASRRPAQQAETHSFQGPDQIAGLQNRQSSPAHTATVTRRTPMISAWRGIFFRFAFRSFRQRVITSSIFRMASS